MTFLPSTTFALRQASAEDSVSSYIVKQTGNPHMMMAKEIDKPLSPASLTKIMTCMMAIESGRMDDVVTIPLEATRVEPTVAGFRPGDRFRLRDLVKAAMVNSSNDAAFAIAIHLGGSVDAFVASMNSRARALGMSRTWFTNPAGYDRGIYSGNQSTARDLMILTERAIRFPEFNTIARMERAVFAELNTGRGYSLATHNKLFNRYSYTVGIKTGYTSLAGPCLIARAEKDGRDMLIVMLNARTDRWSLASSMFDRGLLPTGSAGYQQPVQVASAVRPETIITQVLPAVAVAAERARSLEALKQKVARQTVERDSAGLKATGMTSRMVADASGKKAGKTGTSEVRVAHKKRSGGKAVVKSAKKKSGGKAVVKSAKKRSGGKAVVKSVKKRSGGKAVVKSAKKKTGGKAVVKSVKKRSGGKAVVKSVKKKTGGKAVVKSAKKKSGGKVAVKSRKKGAQASKELRKSASKASGKQASGNKPKNTHTEEPGHLYNNQNSA